MGSGITTVLYPVTDLAKAKALFGVLLGVRPVMDEPYYVGYSVGDQHIGLDPKGHGKGMTGPVGYLDVDDIASTVAALVAAGAEVKQEVTEVGGGKRIASVTDFDGNVIGLAESS